MRNFLFDTFNFLFYQKLIKSTNQQLSDIATKSIKEVKYHLRHSKNWILRLGDGTEESNKRVQNSLNNIWQYTGEFFEVDNLDKKMIEKGIGVNTSLLQDEWNKMIEDTLKEAKLKKPEDITMQTGGKKGIHTKHLAPLLSEMQYIPRKYSDAKW